VKILTLGSFLIVISRCDEKDSQKIDTFVIVLFTTFGVVLAFEQRRYLYNGF